MSIAGHVSRAMLSRYSHVRLEAKRRALDEIAARALRSVPSVKRVFVPHDRTHLARSGDLDRRQAVAILLYLDGDLLRRICYREAAPEAIQNPDTIKILTGSGIRGTSNNRQNLFSVARGAICIEHRSPRSR